MDTPAFPKLQRNEKGNVKLTLEDVAEMREDFKNKSYPSKSALGRAYGITLSSVNYWLQTDEERNAENKRRSTNKRTYNPVTARKYLDKKKALDPEGVRAYRNAINAKSRLRNIEAVRAKDKAYRANKRATEKLQNA